MDKRPVWRTEDQVGQYEPPQVSNWYAKCPDCGKEYVANRFHDRCKECEHANDNADR